MIGVALLTCDRLDYTARTLSTFAHHNDLRDFRLFHADDASEDPRVRHLANFYGFRTVVQNDTRQGWRITRPLLIEAAAKECEWILLLENDIESARPFPWALMRYVADRPLVYCLRLYGRYKDRARLDPCLTTHKRRGHVPVEWRPFRGAPESSQVGEIHWSAQPCVTRRRELLELHRSGMEPEAWTVRVKKNVMHHIGIERTAPIISEGAEVLEATC